MKLTVQPLPARFNLATAVTTYGYYQLAPSRWDKQTKTLYHAFRITPARLVHAAVTQDKSALRIQSPSRVSAAHRLTIKTQLRRMLRLDEDFTAWFKLHAPARRRGFARLYRSATLFEDVVKTITGCNVAWPNTVRMNELLCEHFGNGGFPTPARLASVSVKQLKQTCKVGYRAERIIRLARDVKQGRLDLGTLEDPARTTDDIYTDLRAIHGIGPYAANNLLQHLGRYDRIPIDSETYRHFREVHGIATPTTHAGLRRLHTRIEKHFAPYAPYQFLAYWHDLWFRHYA